MVKCLLKQFFACSDLSAEDCNCLDEAICALHHIRYFLKSNQITLFHNFSYSNYVLPPKLLSTRKSFAFCLLSVAANVQ